MTTAMSAQEAKYLMSVGEGRKEFHTKHGGDSIEVSGFMYYPDGATMEASYEGQLIPVPTDPHSMWRNKLIYREAKLKPAADAFNEHKQNLINWAASCRNGQNDPPGDEAMAKLKQLQEEVVQRRNPVNIARKKVEETTPQQIKDIHRHQEERRAKAEQRMSEIKSIEI